MAQSMLSPAISVKLTGTYRNTLDDASVSSISHPALNYAKTLTSGVNANMANRAWQKKSDTLTSGASDTIDLYDLAGENIGVGLGRDGLGELVVYAEIVAIVIVNENAVTAAGTLEIEPGDTNGWAPIGTHTAANGGGLLGQGIFMKAQLAEAGFAVTDASSHTLKLTANSADVTYSIYLLARHDSNESSSSSNSSSTSSTSSSSTSSSSSSSTSSSSISTSSISTSSSSSSSTSSPSSSSVSSSSISTSSSSSSSSSMSSSSPD